MIISKSDAPLGQFVLLSGKEGEVQGRLSDDEFLILKQGQGYFQGLTVPAKSDILAFRLDIWLRYLGFRLDFWLIYDLGVEIYKERLLFLSPFNYVIVQSSKLWQLVPFVIL